MEKPGGPGVPWSALESVQNMNTVMNRNALDLTWREG